MAATNGPDNGSRGRPAEVDRRPKWSWSRRSGERRRADGITRGITFALVVATAIAVALGVLGIIGAPSRRSDLWFEISRAGIQLWVIAILGGGVAAAFRHLESRRDILRSEQELKTGLISEISECVMTFAMELVRFHKGERKTGEVPLRKALEDAYNTYRVRAAVIGTKLEAYFGEKSSIPTNWDLLTGAFAAFYEFEIEDDVVKRHLQLVGTGEEHAGDLRAIGGEALGELSEAMKRAIENGRSVDMDESYIQAWNHVKEDRLLPYKARLIRDVLDRPMGVWRSQIGMGS